VRYKTSRFFNCFYLPHNRQLHIKSVAFILAFAFYPDLALVRLNKLAAKYNPNPVPSVYILAVPLGQERKVLPCFNTKTNKKYDLNGNKRLCHKITL